MISAFDLALNATWAMEERALESLLDIAARDHDVTPEALEAYRAKSMERAERARVRNGVGIMDVNGALFKRANILTAVSGAMSYDILRADFQTLVDDSGINAVLLAIDSPGGEASGANELAQAIYDARGIKPIVAYVSGTAASAAYWIASAADRVVVDPTALLGSIGVQVAYVERAPQAGEKRYRFVSSQSPLKNPDLGTDAATSQIQGTIDAIAAVFIDTVARHRGVTRDAVLNRFGKGGVFVGRDAISAGLADELGSFERVMTQLAA